MKSIPTAFGIVLLCSLASWAKNPNVEVTISPALDSLKTAASQQFTATVSGSSNTAVIWRVSQGGGTITSAGLYTAPSAAGIVTVTAVSQADNTKSANAIITITAAIHSVTLNWNKAASGCTFEVFRSTISGGYYSQIASDLSALTYTDSSVVSGTTYYYVVAAIINGSRSGYSNQVQAVVP